MSTYKNCMDKSLFLIFLKVIFHKWNETHTNQDTKMNKEHDTINDFLITCKTLKILDFFFNGQAIMGVAQWRHIYSLDWVKHSTIP